MIQDALQHLNTLKDQALAQSAQIGEQLNQGTPPDKLVPLLETQANTIKQLQTGIQTLAQETQINQYHDAIKALQQALQDLAQQTQTQVQKATQKGVRLTGIGGKPHISPRPKK